MQSPTIGRIVHTVLADGKHRPAIIVEVWPGEFGNAECPDGINVQVFIDGSNDASAGVPAGSLAGAFTGEERLAGIAWRTSLKYRDPSDGNIAELMGTWHWPEQV